MELLLICLFLVNDVFIGIFIYLTWRHNDNLNIYIQKLDFYIEKSNTMMHSLNSHSTIITEQLRTLNSHFGRYS